MCRRMNPERRPPASLKIRPEKPPSTRPLPVIVTFVTDDVDGWYERLSVKGVAFETPPRENREFNIYHCFLRDPDGYQIEIQRFNDRAWPQAHRS